MAGVLQHLRSSTLDKRPNPTSMVDGQVAINYASGAPGMFFKDSNGDLVKVGPVHVGSGTPNASPASGGTAGNSIGEQWLDTSGGTYVFKIWDGAAWRSEAGEFVNTTGDTMTGALGVIAGTASAPGVFFSGDTNTGVYAPSADQLAITTGGTARLTTTTSAITSALPVDVPLGSASAPSLTFTGDTNTGIYSPGADQVAVSTNGVKRIEIQADGDIDIDGGNVSIASTNRIKTNDSGGNLTIQGGGTFPGGHIILNGGNGSDNIIFNRSGASASSVETARIDSSGRLLVGTSTAFDQSAPLQVNSSTGESANLYVFGADNSRLNIGSARGSVASPSTLNSVDTIGGIYFRGHDGTSFKTGAQIQAQIDGITPSSDLPSRLVFSTTADGASSPTTHLAIRANGNIHYKSSVINANGVGNSPSAEGIEMGGGFIGQQFPSTSTNGTYFNIFFRGTSIIGSITQNGTTQVSYNTSSDYRLKENIEEISGALIYLKNLKPCKFNFISEPDRTIHGFLAHEVQTIVPEAITGEKDEVDEDGNPQYQGIDQSKLVPLLTAALQEAIAKIEALEGMVAVNNITIDEQQHQLSTLEARLTALESA